MTRQQKQEHCAAVTNSMRKRKSDAEDAEVAPTRRKVAAAEDRGPTHHWLFTLQNAFEVSLNDERLKHWIPAPRPWHEDLAERENLPGVCVGIFDEEQLK